ncbi:matrix metalloproteinase-24-like [Physella acuta]|uniref:matrix metalloproteinase-24-like n=1 Tax=Physella acuta TaxID=109671 RepID=UPI0027DB1EE0|nr:matrix metalloproteinase-24-like [Physella acuta]
MLRPEVRELFVKSVFVYLCVSLATVLTIPVTQPGITDSDSLNYLVQFGYLEPQDPKTGALRTHDSYVQALERFQRMAGIPVTGVLDNATKTMISLPRCGNKDNITLGSARKRRYALQGSKWAKKSLTFKISEYPRGIPREKAEQEVHDALKVWSDVTPLNFILRPFDEKVDIDIKFARRHHGDGNPFDGRGQTLAHAYFPQYGGDAHFDDDEDWTINLSSGINMFQVAAHEFGHSLGLSHSDVSTSLMAPFYRGYQRHFRLDQDDINAIQELYGSRRSRGHEVVKQVKQTPPSRSSVLGVPKICTQPRIDAATMTSDGHTYIFKDKQYYLLNNHGIAEGYPKEISHDWKGLEGPVDSALHWDNGFTYFFKGDHYWKFYNFDLIYVRSIDEGFKGLPGNIDAAFVWGGNGKTYFIKGDKYWRYTLNHVDPGYPKSMSVWTGLPPHIDAALKWKNGRTYFFSGDLYYRYNDVDFDIDTSYPRNIASWWLGCPEKEKLNHIKHNSTNHQQHTGLTQPDTEVTSSGHSEADTTDEEFLTVAGNSENSFSSFNGTSSAVTSNLCLVLVSTLVFRIIYSTKIGEIIS